VIDRRSIVEAIDGLRAEESTPIYVLIQRSVRLLVASGALAPGQRLPSVRALALDLGTAINTVARAYAELGAEGIIVARGGAGSVIATRAKRAVREDGDRLQRGARQLVAYALALGHEPAEVIHAVRAELAATGRLEHEPDAVPAVLPSLPVRAPPRTLPPHAVTIGGLVRHGAALDQADLVRLPRVTLEQPFESEEGWVVPSLRWRGVALRDVLNLADPLPDARVVRVGAGSYVMPLAMADAHSAVLADELDGAALTLEHGAPWRLVVPGGSCYTSVKWVDRLELATS